MAGERPTDRVRYVLVPKPPLRSEVGRVRRVDVCRVLAGWLASTLATVGAVTFIERSVTSSVARAWPGSCFWECGGAGVRSASRGRGQAERATRYMSYNMVRRWDTSNWRVTMRRKVCRW